MGLNKTAVSVKGYITKSGDLERRLLFHLCFPLPSDPLTLDPPEGPFSRKMVFRDP